MTKSLLIGNDINNINNSTTWEKLLAKIIKICGNDITSKNKPFPLLYEEIYLKALKSINQKESELKGRIAEIIDEIEPNEIHASLLEMDITNYLTTNYDYVLQKLLQEDTSTHGLKNNGLIKETKYSVYRHHQIDEKKFWHLHGEINVPKSIVLGFEHYGGQLQQLRNYTVSGTNYKNKNANQSSLHKRVQQNSINEDSWIDFFFKGELHILGLNLGYEETDLWWLITNRARFINEKSCNLNSRIIYYCPKMHRNNDKTAIMEANDICVKFIDLKGEKYYQEVLKIIYNGI